MRKDIHDSIIVERRLNYWIKVKLPVEKQGANLFFQLIAKIYEKNSTIITINQPFSKWGEVFFDAILDRLLHHSHILKITGPSYRLKDVYGELCDREGHWKNCTF